MRHRLPLEVLGLIAPILSRVRETRSFRSPVQWRNRNFSLKERQRHWLREELPTYSWDTLDEVLQLAQPAPEDRDRFPERSNWHSPEDKGLAEEYAPPTEYQLFDALGRLSERYFQWKGNELCIRVGLLEELHELGRQFPVGHIIRHAHARQIAEGFLSKHRAQTLPESLASLHSASRSLRAVVERGLSEGHMHLRGVLSAQEIWADHLLTRPSQRILVSISAPEARLLRLGQNAVRILGLAVLLALRLRLRRAEDLPYLLLRGLDTLYRAPDQAASRAAERDLVQLVNDEVAKALGEGEAQGVRRLEPDLECWLLSIVSPAAHGLLAIRHRDRRDGSSWNQRESIRERVRSLERLHLEAQILLVQLTGACRGLDGKRPFRRRERDARQILDFLHQILFRYLLYHTRHLMLATQHGRTTGLREFKEFNDARQRKSLSRDKTQENRLALDRLFEATPLNQVEGRVSPPENDAADLMPWVLGFACGSEVGNLEKFGLIIHFIKQSHKELEHPTQDRSISRVPHQRYRLKIRNQACRLFRLLSRPHPVVPFIVGLDAANEELTTPPEVLAPAFRFLREFPIEARRLQSEISRFLVQAQVLSVMENRRLGLTYHVGEDFRHILSGLRAIHEVLEFLAFKPGDRLGHATALALSPEVWAAQMGYQAVVPRLEWLDTLVWLQHYLGSGDELVTNLGIEERIQYLSWQIYGSRVQTHPIRGRPLRNQDFPAPPQVYGDWSPLTLWDAWRLRQLDPMIVSFTSLEENRDPFPDETPASVEQRRWRIVQRRVFNQINPKLGSDLAYELLKRYWFDPGVQERGAELETIDMRDEKEAWIALCKKAQQRLAGLLKKRQIVVEVNPTSNWLIGPMERLREHHIFNLTLQEDETLERSVVVTVNSDDPGVFNTSLAHEYYLLGEVLLNRGMGEAEVMDWLEWLRRNGHDYSFLRFVPDTKDRRMASILESLRNRSDRSLLRWLRGERDTVLSRFRGQSPH